MPPRLVSCFDNDGDRAGDPSEWLWWDAFKQQRFAKTCIGCTLFPSFLLVLVGQQFFFLFFLFIFFVILH